ncbi:MAG: SpoIIIAH-like family protein [Eubacterium ventriosum]
MDSSAENSGDDVNGENEKKMVLIRKKPKSRRYAILTNGTSVSDYMVQARLNREQTRSKNKETLLEVINNKDLDENQKKKAVTSMTDLTKTTDMENTVETLLKAKGFEDVLVTITDKQVDVIVNDAEMDETKKAQIENVVKRKTGIAAKNITITPTNNQ